MLGNFSGKHVDVYLLEVGQDSRFKQQRIDVVVVARCLASPFVISDFGGIVKDHELFDEGPNGIKNQERYWSILGIVRVESCAGGVLRDE